MNFGEMIRNERKKRNISQARLGEMVGVSREAVKRWETGRAGITADHADKAFRALGVSITIGADDIT